MGASLRERWLALRSVLFWMHLGAGVVAGAIVLIMSVTGVLLMYERQMIAWSDRDVRSTPPAAGAERLPIGELVARLRAEQPDVTPTAVTVASDPTAPVVVAAAQRSLLVDAYSGRWLGDSSQTVRRVMTELRAWHRWLSVDGEKRPVARAITGWSTVLFLFIICSGPLLWLPRRVSWARVRQVLFFQRGLGGKARDFNWHHVIGVWTAVPLFVVVISALPISFPWFTALVYRARGEEPPAAAAPAGGAAARDAGPNDVPPSFAELELGIARAEARVRGWRTISVRVPEGAAPLSYAIDRGDGGQPQLRSTLVLDRATGEESFEAFRDQGPGRRLRGLMRFAHTGEVWGRLGQTLMGIATAGAVVLVWTGVALALRRAWAWARRRSRVSADVLEGEGLEVG